MPVPVQHNRLMPYLIVKDAAQFIGFMEQVFSATKQAIVPRAEGSIMHGELRIADSVIMFADATHDIGPKPAGIFIYVDNVEEAYRKALEHGAVSTMEPQQQPYGYTCGFRDPFGNDWWPVAIPAE